MNVKSILTTAAIVLVVVAVVYRVSALKTIVVGA
jgi:hypothetical protein